MKKIDKNNVILSDSEEFKVKSVGAEPSVYRHSDTLPMGCLHRKDFPTKSEGIKSPQLEEGGKGESGISPLQDKIDTFKLESEMQAATAIVEANMAEFHAEQQEIKEKQQQEREALIAEAHRLAGRAEAFNVIAEFANISSLVTLKRIKESKIYKEIPYIKTWEEYCKYIGFSRQKIDLDIDNLNTFGERLSRTSPA